MAMFNLKDSEDIKIQECHTDSSELVQGERLRRIGVADSTAFSTPASPNKAKKRGLGMFLAENIFISSLSLVVTLIAAYLAWRFGWV